MNTLASNLEASVFFQRALFFLRLGLLHREEIPIIRQSSPRAYLGLLIARKKLAYFCASTAKTTLIIELGLRQPDLESSDQPTRGQHPLLR